MVEVLRFRVPEEFRAHSRVVELEYLIKEAQSWLLKALRRFGAMTDILDPVRRHRCSAVFATDDACPFAVDLLVEELCTLCVYVRTSACLDESFERFRSLVSDLCASISFHNRACGFLCSFMRMGDVENERWLHGAEVLYYSKHASTYEILEDFISVHNGRLTRGTLMANSQQWIQLG